MHCVGWTGDEPISGPSLARALSLLREALVILDALNDYPEAGARIQHVIDQLEKQHQRIRC